MEIVFLAVVAVVAGLIGAAASNPLLVVLAAAVNATPSAPVAYKAAGAGYLVGAIGAGVYTLVTYALTHA